ncbi:MAG: dolichyl-phosphate beta-glucosyltransferase [archaeon]
MELSIIIPAYNEEKRITKTLDSYISFFNKKIDFEIFIVLNGCRDNTLDIVKDYAKKYKLIKYINIAEAIGKGGAVIEGFKRVNGNLIGFVDADMSTPPRSFFDLYKKINGNDGIIASRWTKGSKILVKQKISRRIASRVFNYLVRLFFSIDLRDTQCGAKLFKRKAIKDAVNDLGITKWAWDIDLLYIMKRKGYKVIEIPTVWDDKTGSQLKLGRTVPEMFLSILRLRLIYSKFKFLIDIYDKLPESLKVHHKLK